MLILTRKKGQRIVIGEEITVEILQVDGGAVRIGVTAPRDVQVDREEIAVRKRDEQRGRERA